MLHSQCHLFQFSIFLNWKFIGQTTKLILILNGIRLILKTDYFICGEVQIFWEGHNFFFKSPFVGHVTQSKAAKLRTTCRPWSSNNFFPGNDQWNFSHFSQAHFFPISCLDGQILERPRNINVIQSGFGKSFWTHYRGFLRC